MAKNLSGFFDYLKWRGDLSFSAVALNEVDALIFTQISYLNFKGLISENFENAISLYELAENFKKSPDYETRKNPGLVINPLTVDLLFKCAESNRFKDVKACNFRDIYDAAFEEQFSALTFAFEENGSSCKSLFAAFRGTDDTLVGWKEDFNLAFMKEVPAQKHAVEYLKEVLEFSTVCGTETVYAGGHSKGGNLAVYSAANCHCLGREISRIFNFDGPGFSESTLNLPEFKKIEPKITSVYPQFSIIGMLFHHFDSFKVAKSSETLVMQHDPFSWGIIGCKFDENPALDEGSEYFYRAFNGWFEKLTEEKRIEFVETIFDVLASPNARDLNELSEHWQKNAFAILKAIANLDSDIRKSTRETASQLIKEAFQLIQL